MHVALAGNLVPAGTTLVTPGVSHTLRSRDTFLLSNFCHVDPNFKLVIFFEHDMTHHLPIHRSTFRSLCVTGTLKSHLPNVMRGSSDRAIYDHPCNYIILTSSTETFLSWTTRK